MSQIFLVDFKHNVIGKSFPSTLSSTSFIKSKRRKHTKTKCETSERGKRNFYFKAKKHKFSIQSLLAALMRIATVVRFPIFDRSKEAFSVRHFSCISRNHFCTSNWQIFLLHKRKGERRVAFSGFHSQAHKKDKTNDMLSRSSPCLMFLYYCVVCVCVETKKDKCFYPLRWFPLINEKGKRGLVGSATLEENGKNFLWWKDKDNIPKFIFCCHCSKLGHWRKVWDVSLTEYPEKQAWIKDILLTKPLGRRMSGRSLEFVLNLTLSFGRRVALLNNVTIHKSLVGGMETELSRVRSRGW